VSIIHRLLAEIRSQKEMKGEGVTEEMVLEPGAGGLGTKKLVLFAVLIFGITAGIFFSIDTIRYGSSSMWMMNASSIALCSILLIFAITRPLSPLPYIAVITFASIYGSYLFLSGGNYDLGYFWIILLPLSAVFLLGWKFGTFYSVACLLICAGGFLYNNAYPGRLNMAETSLIWRIFTAYVFSFAIAVLYDLNENFVTTQLVQANTQGQPGSQGNHRQRLFSQRPGRGHWNSKQRTLFPSPFSRNSSGLKFKKSWTKSKGQAVWS
jgi:hypothetical protein